MREIILRGKIDKKSPFVYGNLHIVAHGGGKPQYEIWSLNDSMQNCYVVKRNTVGQYTGLTDRNGNEIFEGDIVTMGATMLLGKLKGVVEYNSKTARYIISFKNKVYHYEDLTKAEVIGNIYDNPELLESF